MFILKNKETKEVTCTCEGDFLKSYDDLHIVIETQENVVVGYDEKKYLESECPKPPKEWMEAQIQKQLTDAVQHVLDAKAQELLYDNCLSVCSYIDTGVPKFDAEGRAFRAWRSQVWAKGYEILAEVQEGKRAIPTTEELLAELPKLVITYTE